MKYLALILTATLLWTSHASAQNVIWNYTGLGAAPATDDKLFIYDTSATASKTMTIANLFTAPAIAGYTLTGTGTIGNGCTLTTPILSGSITGTYTLAGTPTLTAPTINAYTLTGTGTIGNGCTLTTPILSGSITGTYTLAGTPTITSPTITSPTITGAKVTPNVQTITGDGAITIQSGVVLLTKGSAAAVTLAAPSSQDGTIIEITSTTDFAHVVTVTGGLWDGTATTNTTITFPVVAGGAVRIIAFGTDWYVLSNQGTTIAP